MSPTSTHGLQSSIFLLLSGQNEFFFIKMINILLESSQKRPLLKLGRSNPFENGLGRIKRQFWASNVNIIPCQEPLRGMLTKMCKKMELCEP